MDAHVSVRLKGEKGSQERLMIDDFLLEATLPLFLIVVKV